jgi:hypothetical protein
MSSKAIKVHPVIFRYKSLNFQVNEKDDNISIEITNNNSSPIQTTYNPVHPKGHNLLIKLEYNSSEKQQYKEPGLHLLFHINTALCWYAGISENENGIMIEIFTGSYPMFVDQINKVNLINNNSNTINNTINGSNNKWVTASTNHSVVVKILNPTLQINY